MPKRRRPDHNMDRGSAVLLTMVLAALLSAVGAGLIMLAGTERAVAGNFQTGMQILYGAEAVAERVVLDLITDQRWTEALGGQWQSPFVAVGTRPTAPWGEVIDLVAMTNDLQSQTDGVFRAGVNAPRWRLFASGSMPALLGGGSADVPAYLIAWVADDPSEVDGDPAVERNGVVMIRAHAIGLRGLRRAVHIVLSRQRESVTEGEGAETLEPSAVRILSWREVR